MVRHPLHLLIQVSHLPGRHDEDRAEDLFGEIPVLACRPAPDVTRTEASLGDHPRVFDPLAGPTGVEGDGDVEATTNTREPAAPGEVSEELASAVRGEAENRGSAFDIERAGHLAMELLEEGAVLPIDALHARSE